MTRQLNAVLFDKDGTLFDFQATWAGVAEETLMALAEAEETRIQMAMLGGFDPVERRFRPGAPMVAGSVREVAELWAPLLPDLRIDDIEAIADRIAIDAASRGALVPAVPDLPRYLEELRAEGFRLGIATHDSEESARVQVDAVGALEAFDFIAGYDSGHGLKPGPGMLLAFANATSVPASEIVMVGDSQGDLAMVREAQAGLAVGVLTGPSGEEHLSPFADHILPSIADLPDLLRSLSTGQKQG